jgi:REP element-mobilizing transposase RayT
MGGSTMKFNPDIHHRRSIRLKDYDYTQAGVYFVTICAWRQECIFGEVVAGEIRLSIKGKIASEQWMRLEKRFPGIDCSAFVIMPNHIHGIVTMNGGGRGAGEVSEDNSHANPPLRPYNAGEASAGIDHENHPPHPYDDPRDMHGGGRGAGEVSGAIGHENPPLRPYNAGEVSGDIDHEDHPPRPYDNPRDVHGGGRGAGEVSGDIVHKNPPLRPYAHPIVVPGSLGAIVRAYKASVTWRVHAMHGYDETPIWQRNYYEHILRNDADMLRIQTYILDNPQLWEQDQLHPQASPNKFNQNR